MPLKRLEKTRGTLPSGYQFGDARSPSFDPIVVAVTRAMQSVTDPESRIRLVDVKLIPRSHAGA